MGTCNYHDNARAPIGALRGREWISAEVFDEKGAAVARFRSVLCATALLATGALLLSGCAEEIEIPVPPLPEPTQPEPAEPEVHALSWYTDQVWNEHARVEQAEEIIAGCMAFNGFEYVPEVGEPSAEEETDPRAELAWAKRHGFGIVDAFLEGAADVEPEMTGPNAEYFAELDPEEQQEYRDALDGTQETGFEGCRSEAQLFTMNTDPARVYQDDTFRDLVAALGALPDEIAQDERVLAVTDDWAVCMSGHGYGDVTQRGELEAQLRDDFQAMPVQDEASLDEFLAREVHAATAEVECLIETDWYDVTREVEAEYEEDFVDAHLAELEALVDKYGV